MAPSGGAPNTPPNGPPPSNPQTAPNLVAFDPRQAVPQQPVYLQRNDSLWVTFITSQAAVIVRLNYRWLTPEGEIKEGELDTPPFFGISTFAIPIYEGWLLSIAARYTSALVPGSWTFMQVGVVRGSTILLTQNTSALIWQGFINGSSSNGWPGTPAKELTDGTGTIRSITGSTPAAGADINEVVPGQRRWTLLSFRGVLATSAAVANRNPGFLLDDGANQLFKIQSSVAQVASTTIGYEFTPGQTFFNDTLADQIIPAPAFVQIRSAFHIRSATAGIQAADQWSGVQYLVLEWGTWDN